MNEFKELFYTVPKDMVVCLDTETTGATPDDEILQCSLVDGTGKVLFDGLFHPDKITEWPEAEKFNKISPEMVKEKPTFYAAAPTVEKIIKGHELLIGYNHEHFDIPILEKYGISLKGVPTYDLIQDVAFCCGEWNAKYGDWKYQSLTKAAEHFVTEFTPHNSTEDCKATVDIFYKLKDELEVLRDQSRKAAAEKSENDGPVRG